MAHSWQACAPLYLFSVESFGIVSVRRNFDNSQLFDNGNKIIEKRNFNAPKIIRRSTIASIEPLLLELIELIQNRN